MIFNRLAGSSNVALLLQPIVHVAIMWLDTLQLHRIVGGWNSNCGVVHGATMWIDTLQLHLIVGGVLTVIVV